MIHNKIKEINLDKEKKNKVIVKAHALELEKRARKMKCTKKSLDCFKEMF